MEKVWIYPINRELNATESTELKKELNTFISGWKAHGEKLNATFNLLHDHFIILKADEAEVKASGCSIDDSVRFLKDLEKKYNIELFDRLKMPYQTGGKIKLIPLSDIANKYQSGEIKDESTVFNTSITSAEDFKKNWQKSFRESPFYRFV